MSAERGALMSRRFRSKQWKFISRTNWRGQKGSWQVSSWVRALLLPSFAHCAILPQSPKKISADDRARQVFGFICSGPVGYGSAPSMIFRTGSRQGLVFGLCPLKPRALLIQSPSPIEEELESFPRFHAQELALKSKFPSDHVGLPVREP